VIAAINHEVDSRIAAADPGMRHLNSAIQVFFGDRTKHVSGLAAVSRTFATEVMIHRWRATGIRDADRTAPAPGSGGRPARGELLASARGVGPGKSLSPLPLGAARLRAERRLTP
jgi:hypothetical protein